MRAGLFVIPIALLCLSDLQAQWVVHGGALEAPDSENTGANALTVDPDGNVYVVGFFQDHATFGEGRTATTVVSAGQTGAFIARYTHEGNLHWLTTGLGSNGASARAVALTGDGHVHVLGDFGGHSLSLGSRTRTAVVERVGEDGGFLCKYTRHGELVWARSAGIGSSVNPTSMALAPDGKILVGGRFSGTISFEGSSLKATSDGEWDSFLVAFDPDGNPLWLSVIVVPFRSWGIIDVAIGHDGSAFVTGYFGEAPPSSGDPQGARFGSGQDAPYLEHTAYRNFFVAKYAANGSAIWARGAAGWAEGHGVTVDGQGNVYVSGYLAEYAGTVTFGEGANSRAFQSRGLSDIVLLKYNPSGELIWARQAGGLYAEIGEDATVKPDGTILVAGSFGGEAMFGDADKAMTLKARDHDLYVAHYTSDGELMGVGQAGSDGVEFDTNVRFPSVAVDGSGRIYVSGRIDGTVQFMVDPEAGPVTVAAYDFVDMFLAQFVGLAPLPPLAVGIEEVVPSENGFTVSDAYPNPAARQARFNVTVTAPQNVRVEVVSPVGQLITVPFEGFILAGVPTLIEIDVSELAGGLYIVDVVGKVFRKTTFVAVVR